MYCISWGWSVLPGFEQRLFCNSRFVWTSLNMMYIVCIHSLTHTHRHTQTFREYQPNTHTHRISPAQMQSQYLLCSCRHARIQDRGERGISLRQNPDLNVVTTIISKHKPAPWAFILSYILCCRNQQEKAFQGLLSVDAVGEGDGNQLTGSFLDGVSESVQLLHSPVRNETVKVS